MFHKLQEGRRGTTSAGRKSEVGFAARRFDLRDFYWTGETDSTYLTIGEPTKRGGVRKRSRGRLLERNVAREHECGVVLTLTCYRLTTVQGS